jgi:hypothetical protein
MTNKIEQIEAKVEAPVLPVVELVSAEAGNEPTQAIEAPVEAPKAVSSPQANPLTIVQQLADKSGLLAKAQGELTAIDALNKQLATGLDMTKAELTQAQQTIAERVTMIDELSTKLTTVEAELAKQMERAEKAEKCLSLQAYQDVHNGTKAIEDIAVGDGSTVVQQWRAIKDKQAKLKFYKEHEAEIMRLA